jgi:FAD/FMN-containing dehydrogenase
MVFSPSHYERLAAFKKKLDPKNLLGSDRNIPPGE